MKHVSPLLLLIGLLLLAPAAAATPPCIYLRFPGYHIEGVDTNGNGVYELVVELIHWNLVSARGVSVIRYCLSNQTYNYHQDLRDIIYREETVFGYPELYYGYKPWSRWGAYEGEVELPARISQVPRFWVVANYSFTHQARLPVDVATDSWITYAWKPDRVGRGDAEIMVWFYHSNLNPAGRRIATVRCPTYINGRLQNALYEVWHAEFEWRYIAFVLVPPLRSGSVAVDFSCILENAARLIDIHGTLYLNDVELGVEYGLPGYTRAAFKWDVYRFYVTTHDPEKPIEASVAAVGEDGAPIAGIPVTLQGRPAGETGGDGTYTARLKPGLYTVEVPLHYAGGGLNCTFKRWSSGRTENYTLLAPGYKDRVKAIYSCTTTEAEQPKPLNETSTATPEPAPKLILMVNLTGASGTELNYTLYLKNTGDASANASIEVRVEPHGGVGRAENILVQPGTVKPVKVAVHLPSPGNYTIVFRVSYNGGSLEERVKVIYSTSPQAKPANQTSTSVPEKSGGETAGEEAPWWPQPYLVGVALVALGVAALAAKKLGKV